MIIAMDPPRHDQLRALIARGFTARPVAANAPAVRALARELIAGFAGAGQVEFVDAYSGALPLLVVGSPPRGHRRDHRPTEAGTPRRPRLRPPRGQRRRRAAQRGGGRRLLLPAH